MPVCDACGAEVDGGARFCGECGALVRAQNPRDTVSDGRAPKTRNPQTGTRPKGKDTREAAKDAKSGRVVKPPEPKPELRSTIRGVSTPPAPANAEPMSIKRGAQPSAQPAGPSPAGSPTESTTPPPLRSSPSVVPPSFDAEPTQRTEFQRLLDEVESGFDAILVTGDSAPPPPRPDSGSPVTEDATVTSENQFDQEQAKTLFRDLVVANAQSIRDFMIEIRLGEPHAAWIDHCEPAVQAILRSAEGMGLTELVDKVRRFIQELQAARGVVAQSQIIRGDPREKLIDAYSNLIAFFPEAFAAEAESNKREAVIVHALLSKVPGLFPLTIDRIYATGLASLGLFYVSRPREIAELAGVSLEIAERIVERFREYRKTASELSPAKGRTAERARLKLAIEETQRATKAYDHAQPVSGDRRVHRRERFLAMADVAIYMARLGEVDRLRRLEKMAFAQRIEALHAFLEESERRALAEQGAR